MIDVFHFHWLDRPQTGQGNPGGGSLRLTFEGRTRTFIWEINVVALRIILIRHDL